MHYHPAGQTNSFMPFIRPGSKSNSAFGIDYDRPQDDGTSGEPSSTTGEAGRLPSRHQHPSRAEAPRSHEGSHLPVAKHRHHILYLVETHATVVVLGETGSGKTTQIPKYLHEAGWTAGNRQVACTQPRRAAATTIAARVAEELGCELGTTVGYSVRFDNVGTKGVTKIKYLTDGTLIREMMDDPLLTSYSVIMVDEAHERSLATDMLLGLLKKVQRRRPDLRLIISSATLQAEQLQEFFDGSTAVPSTSAAANQGQNPVKTPAIISIEGRNYPVEVHYLQQPVSDYVQAAMTAAIDIHKTDLPGDILIFLTGQDECEAAVRLLDEEAQRLAHSSGYSLKMLPLPLYAGLPGANQRLVFQHTPRGYRKIVAATNVAETSLTLEGVVYVIDSCFVKQRCFNPILGLESLLIAPISKASAVQRAGRAGRVRSGRCFRLCTEEAYVQLPQATVPEMQRSDLTSMVLQLKALGIDNIMKFEWLAPPPAETMVRALEALHALGVLNDDAKLTEDIGLPLAGLPLEPSLGRCLLASGSLGCNEEMLTIASLLSVPNIWILAPGAHRTLDEARSRFAAAEGDLVTMLNVVKGWQENARSQRWCAKHFLNQHSLLKADDVRQQLQGQLRRLGVPMRSCEGELLPLLKAITQGMFMNVACFDHVQYNPLSPESDPGTNVYRLVRHAISGQPLNLRIHASSVLRRSQPQWVVFHSVQQADTGWYEMQGVTAIEPEWLTELAPHMFQQK